MSVTKAFTDDEATPSQSSTPAHVRDDLVAALRLDLVGPDSGHPLAEERLPIPPSRWYLTGFLVPRGAGEAQRSDETAQEELDLAGIGEEGGDDEAIPEQAAARKVFFPSSLGLSVLVPPSVGTLHAEVTWGDYRPMQGESDAPASEGGESASAGVASTDGKRSVAWQRVPRRESVTVPVPAAGSRTSEAPVPDSGGLVLVASARTVPGDGSAGLPSGTRSVAVFLVNNRAPVADEVRDVAFAFQARLGLHVEDGFVARPNIRGRMSDDADERVADLQYSDAVEYAVGHGISARACLKEDGDCGEVCTDWIPSAEVERVEPAAISDVQLGMETLAAAADAAALSRMLMPLVTCYGAWIDRQRERPLADERRAEVARELLDRAGMAKQRIAAGISALQDPLVFTAFTLANRAMATAARQRGIQQGLGEPATLPEPAWRPFQLAFLLMNVRGIADARSGDRDVVDLLFFPTGGGKTEAYLGLAAFTLILRRLRNPGIASAGVSVLMRYTLRLLTLDQLGRAATLICALELMRQQDVERLGRWPFEIGLWVGRAATPNRMGEKGDRDEQSARARTLAYQRDSRGKPCPLPIETCPWCGTRFSPSSFQLKPNPDHPADLRVLCVNRRCEFTRDNPLPILAVDEPIYRRLPCFLIATVDKFAQLPWVGRVGALFGLVQRGDKDGFYGPSDPRRGSRLPVDSLPPPDLIIQDELHLISGPLGTIAGLYEAAIDELATRSVNGERVGTKVIASTATVRRAEEQIRALFARRTVEMFPPASPNRRDSYFAKTVAARERHARRYVGVAAPGRSLKVVLLRTYLALLGAAQRAYGEGGGAKNERNAADPYMTLLGYFNALRELGGSRRIVEDEVNTRLARYAERTRVGEARGSFANRRIAHEVLELTSRVPTHEVADAKRRLALAFHQRDRVDVALATNMISVGLDITRLGLMVVLGQPKTSAEYIQATSRVGRDADRPGFVVTLLNVHRPRDRSHYERFAAYHQSFYRTVEATSVTPFAPRALDRALPAVVVGLARHGIGDLTPPKGAAEITAHRQQLAFVTEVLSRRAEEHCKDVTAADADELRRSVRMRVADLLDEWDKIAQGNREKGAGLQYQREEGAAPPLLFSPLDPALAAQPRSARKFRAGRSMRDVEPEVNLWARRMDGVELEDEQ